MNNLVTVKYYNQIEGWVDYEDLYDFFALKCLPNGSKFIEVGVWLGRSICYLGQRVKQLNKEVEIFAVDHFEGSGSFVGEQQVHEEMIKRYGGSIFSQFEFNLKNLDLENFIKPIKMDSATASLKFDNESIDVIFLDADHSYKSVKKDLECWYPKVKKGGILAGHDYTWESVRKAVNEFLIPRPKKMIQGLPPLLVDGKKIDPNQPQEKYSIPLFRPPVRSIPNVTVGNEPFHFWVSNTSWAIIKD